MCKKSRHESYSNSGTELTSAINMAPHFFVLQLSSVASSKTFSFSDTNLDEKQTMEKEIYRSLIMFYAEFDFFAFHSEK
jgi:hypothetical protein